MLATFTSTLRYAALSLAAFIAFSPMMARAEIEEIVVQAQRRAANLQDIGAAVTALDQLTIDRRGIENITEFSFHVPNLTAGAGLPAYTLRGLGPQGPIGAAGDPGFAVHVNGVYAARSAAAAIDYFDLERIELLRGPQGTLYGRNSIAGTMNIIYKKPVMNHEAFGDISFGQFSHQRLRFVANTPIIKNMLALRVAGVIDQRDGYYRTPNTGQELNDEDDFLIRTSLLYQPTKEFSAILTWVYGNDRSLGGDTKLLEGVGDRREITTNRINLRRGEEGYRQARQVHSHFATSVVEWTPANMPFRVKSTSGYQQSWFYFDRDNDHTETDFVRLTLWDDTWAASTELEITSNDKKPMLKGLSWVVAANYWHESTPRNGAIITQGEDNVAAGDAGSLYLLGFVDTDSQIKNDNWAIFGETSFNAGEFLSNQMLALTLTGGVRYGVTEKEFEQLRNFPGLATPCGGPDNSACKGDWDAVTWKVALNYDVPDNFRPGLIDAMLPYFIISTGHRPGGFNFAPDDEFDEENLLAYELGIKNTLWNKRIELNFGGFYYDMEDMQISQVANGVSTVLNLPDAEMFGIEVEARAEPISGLRLNFTFGWQKSEIKSKFCSGNSGRSLFAGATHDPSCQAEATAARESLSPHENLEGNTLPRVPEFNFAIGAEYEYPIARINGALTGRVDVVWRDDLYYFQFNNPTDVQEAYALVDLRLIYTHNSDRFSLEAYVENVGDEDVFTNMEFLDSVNRLVYLNEPRTYGLKLSARY